MTRRAGRLLGALILLSGTPLAAGAQLSGVPHRSWPVARTEPVPAVPAAPADVLRRPGGAFAASLLVPGAGQAALGLWRWPLYAALEAGFWTLHLEARGDVARLTDAYRDLAWEVARGSSEPPRREGTWGYYETMSTFLTSGDYDDDAAAPGVQPETDVATYNGYVWSLARSLYLPGGVGDPSMPEYEQALAYYDDRAAGPAFLWSWIGNEAELARFRSLIGEADDEARTATGALGLVLANHLISAIDALIAARTRSEDRLRVESRVERRGSGLGFTVQLTLPMQGRP